MQSCKRRACLAVVLAHPAPHPHPPHPSHPFPDLRPYTYPHNESLFPTHTSPPVTPVRYDGQVFVKPPEVLTRDRLLASYQVRPVLDKLRQTLLGAGVILLASSVLLVGLLQSGTDEYGVYGERHAMMRMSPCRTWSSRPQAAAEHSAPSHADW